MKFFAVAMLLAVAACGAEGTPIRPSANIGLNIGPDGIATQASAALTSGIFSLGLNL